MKTKTNFNFGKWIAVITGLTFILASRQGAIAQTFSNGDVFVAIGNGSVQWRHANDTLIKTLTVPTTAVPSNSFTTGMAFDQQGNLYVTMFDSQTVGVFDNTGNFTGTFGSGYTAEPESIVFDSSGNAYVGQASFGDAPSNGVASSTPILKFNSTGVPVTQYVVDRESRGTDWVDLGGDQCTIYYTSEGTHVKVFNGCTGNQLPDLNAVALSGQSAYAHRLLANGDTLVADSSQIVRLDNTGSIIQTYAVTNETQFFALNLDPDGTSFWSADLLSGDVFKFNIATGAILQRFNAGVGAGKVGGLVVKGEITAATTAPTGHCVTRNARFWFTHAFSSNPACVTLLRALQANDGGVSLGFLRLPATFENGRTVLDATDALIEALSFYYRSRSRTGESGGTQSEKLPASRLCEARKLMAVELIAATANVRLLGTNPGDCTYTFNHTITNFPPDLLQQAETVGGGADRVAVGTMTLLLRKFNQAGVANNFIGNNLVQCSPTNTALLRGASSDPTTEINCPGLNTSCNTAEEIAFSNTNDFLRPARFSESLSLLSFISNPITNFTIGTTTNSSTVITNVTHILPTPSCSVLGSNGSSGFVTTGAMWKITPDIGVAGRSFTADTMGSNIGTVLSVFSGTCDNLTEITCGTENIPLLNQSRVTFTTDGVNTFYIVAESADGSVGRLNLHVTSP